MMQRVALLSVTVVLAGLARSSDGAAQSRVMPVAQIRAALETTAGQWIQFRNFNGRQWVYFTGLVIWKCGLKEIRYSVNSRDLSQRFALPSCNPQTPFHLDPVKDRIYLTFPLGGAKTVSVQIVYTDDVESPVHTYRPCDVNGDVTCGLPVE